MKTTWCAAGCSVTLLVAGLAIAAVPTTAPIGQPTTAPTTAPAVLAAGPTTGPAVAPDVAALIQQLDADDWQARDAAAAKLVAMGEAVRPAVADAAEHSASPEVRTRAAGVIARLKQIAADRPTTVALHLRDANPRQAFAALAKQGGIGIRIWPEQLWTAQFGVVPKVTVDVQDRPFWAALAEVCRQVGARPERMGFDEDLTIIEGRGDDPLAGPRCEAGRFTVIAQSYSRQRQINYGDGQTSGGDSLSMLALLDPKLRLDRSNGGVVLDLERATDDKGNSLLPASGTSQPQMDPRGGPMLEMTLNLGPVSSGAKRIALLSGRLTAAVVSRSQRMAIDDIGHAGRVTRVVGPYTVELQKADVADRLVSYTVLIRSNGWAMPNLSSRDFCLEDADGQPIRGGGSSGSSGFNGQLRCEAQVRTTEPIHGPVRLVWDVVTQTKSIAVPFEFHDLKLPPA